MAFLLKDGSRTLVGCFNDIGNSQFSFFATDFAESFIEKVTAEVLADRSEMINESIRFKSHKIIQILKENTPESCAMAGTRFDLTFIINTHQFKIFFDVSPCSPSEAGSFSAGLLKLAIENTVLVDRMRKALDAKDQEIEEYKLNGGTLIRETLATKKFEFQHELQLSTVKLKEETFIINPSALLKTSNIPALCSIINAENVLEELRAKHKSDSSQRAKLVKTKNRNPIVQRLVDKKFEYVSDEDEASPAKDESTSLKKKLDRPVETSKKSKGAQKSFEL